jgi:hypothetical protein
MITLYGYTYEKGLQRDKGNGMQTALHFGRVEKQSLVPTQVYNYRQNSAKHSFRLRTTQHVL